MRGSGSDTATVLSGAVRRVAADVPPQGAVPTDPDWADRAEAAGLLPLLVDSLRRAGTDVPEPAARAALVSTGLHLQALADLGRLADTLDHAGVRWLVFKGPVLSDHVYRRPGLRTYHDLDVLVHPADLGRALDALTADGTATMLDRNWEHIRESGQSEVVLLLERGSVLDLHWHVISNPRTRAEIGLDIGRLFAAATPVRIGNRVVLTLDPIDTVIHVALHAALSGGHQLRWLLDLQQAVRFAAPTPDALRERAEQLGALLPLRVMLERAARDVDPGLADLCHHLGPRTGWLLLCATTRWWARLDVAPGGYSGWIVFASTRRTTAGSLRALRHSARVTLHRGKARRSAVVDRSVLHRPGGTAADRDAWLALARSHVA